MENKSKREKFLPPELASLSVRLRGVDTPEKGRRAKCNAEKQAAAAATAFAEEAIQKAGSIVVRDPAWGKWGGRVVADLILDDFSLSSALLEAGHARRYDGGKRGGCVERSRGKSEVGGSQREGGVMLGAKRAESNGLGYVCGMSCSLTPATQPLSPW